MSSNLKVNLHGNKPVHSDIIVSHIDRIIIAREIAMMIVVRDDEWMIEIGIVVMIIDLIRDETFRPGMQVEAFRPEIGVKLLLGEIDCLISSGKK